MKTSEEVIILKCGHYHVLKTTWKSETTQVSPRTLAARPAGHREPPVLRPHASHGRTAEPGR